MSDEEFERFLRETMTSFLDKQAKLDTSYGVSAHSRWHYDQATEKLELFDAADRMVVEAKVIDLGSYSPRSVTWKWAWANEHVVEGLRTKAEPLKKLTDVTGLQLFSVDSAFKVDGEKMAWELAGICVHHLGAIGAYKASSADTPSHTFLAITSIKRHAD